MVIGRRRKRSMDARLMCLLLVATAIQAKDIPTIEKRSSTCFDGLGCFSNDAPFFSLQRPISFLPQSPSIINVKFTLFTRQSVNSGHLIKAGDAAGLKLGNFNAARGTKFLVHGFIDNGDLADWMKETKTELLKEGDYNVVIVDWGSGSLALYGQATANTRVVGALIAQLIEFMGQSTGARPENMHVIGHSLGSHVAGYAGERLHSLGRITGLDPAEPYFQNTDKIVRLDPTDALFVDVIHTDGAPFFSTKLGLGMIQACGHVDYYPNGGHDQPGCDNSPITRLLAEPNLVSGVREFVACNHHRAVHFFKESINSACPFEGFLCNSEEDFNAGKCLPCSGQACGYMGLHADRVKPAAGKSLIKYYLKTSFSSKYCVYHYKVSLTFANPAGAKEERGQISLHLVGSSGQIQQVKVTNDNIAITPGHTYTFLLTSPNPIGDVRSVDFIWVHSSKLLDPTSWNPLGLRHPEVYLDKIKVESGEEQKTALFCANNLAVETDLMRNIAKKC